MIEHDTVELLRECDAGIRMGMSSLEQVIPEVQSPHLQGLLQDGLEKHRRLDQELDTLLSNYNTQGKAPNPMAQGMSWVKAGVEMTMMGGDDTIASLMTDGCNMGVKSLYKYRNQYKAAGETARDIAKRIADAEAQLAVDLRSYL